MRLVRKRSTGCGYIYSICLLGSFMIATSYATGVLILLPIPTARGVDLLVRSLSFLAPPYVTSVVITSCNATKSLLIAYHSYMGSSACRYCRCWPTPDNESAKNRITHLIFTMIKNKIPNKTYPILLNTVLNAKTAPSGRAHWKL